MLVKIEKHHNLFTLALANGRVISGYIDNRDNVELIENTTELKDDLAGYALGVAIVNDENGTDTLVWRHLCRAAENAKKYVEKRMNEIN